MFANAYLITTPSGMAGGTGGGVCAAYIYLCMCGTGVFGLRAGWRRCRTLIQRPARQRVRATGGVALSGYPAFNVISLFQR
ncbi:hypothetical protein KCP75_16000 [Salmonella enterica subsp. enterica]|nr:hypothetical protein KCP75_16000 [Salmonella enterica subsp. enterica]